MYKIIEDVNMNLNDQKVVQKDMDFLYLGNLKTVTFNLALPAKGKYGAREKSVSWIQMAG